MVHTEGVELRSIARSTLQALALALDHLSRIGHPRNATTIDDG